MNPKSLISNFKFQISNLTWLSAFTLALLPTLVRADAPTTQPDDEGLQVAYVGDPPAAGQVTTRLEAAGARWSGNTNLCAYAWCTKVTGLTTHQHPTFVWYLNNPTDDTIKINLSDPAKHTTVRLWQSSGSVAKGIHVLDTSALDLSLDPTIEYKWTVAVELVPDDPSKNLDANGTIRRVEKSDPVAQGHCFYDSLAGAATVLANAQKANNQPLADKATTRLQELIHATGLPDVTDFTATIDTASSVAQ